ncbi:MAG: T9SS type A sorting domain-containing protein [Saprospiraceae bacterium]|nr:T9SS type A sorting domain-containing protein [Saprospiraceae bacterium]
MHIKNFFFLLVSFFLGMYGLQAQCALTTTFSGIFPADPSDLRVDYAVAATQNMAGNYAILGFRQKTIGNNNEYLLTFSLLDTEGNLIAPPNILNLTQSGNNLVISQDFSNAKIIETFDDMGVPNGYAVAAAVLHPTGLRTSVLAKLDLSGCVTWAKTFQELDMLDNLPIGLFQEDDGDLLLFVQTKINTNSGYTSLFIVGPSGSPCTHFDYQNNSLNFPSLIPTAVTKLSGMPNNARYAVAGKVFSNNTGVFYLDDTYAVVFNTFSFYDLNSSTAAEPITSLTQDGDYLVMCGQTGTDALLAKVEPFSSSGFGSFIWSKRYLLTGVASPISPQTQPLSLKRLSGGDYSISGYVLAFNMPGVSKGFQLLTNNNGAPQWLRHYGDAPTVFFDGLSTADDGMLFVGGNYTGNVFTRSEQLAVKTDALGKLAECSCFTEPTHSMVNLQAWQLENDLMQRQQPACTPSSVTNLCSGLPPIQVFCDQFSPSDTCVANFAYAIGDCGEVTFTDLSMLAGTVSWSWSFPGGTPSSSTDQNPIVSYPASNNYVACLTVDNGLVQCTFCGTFDLIYDDEPPVCSLPAPMVLPTEPGVCHNNTNVFLTIPQDNCDNHPDLNCVRSDGLPIHDPFPKGITIIYCTATDASGNSSTCSTSVTVNDVEPPIAICNALVTVALGADCSVTLTPALIDGGSTDNCPMMTMSLDKTFFTGCQTTLVTLSVTDCGGTVDQCSATVEIRDLIDPVIMDCPDDITVTGAIGASGACSAFVGFSTPTASDNCGIASLENDYNLSGDASDTYYAPITTVVWTAIDECNNVTTCSHVVTVVCDSTCCTDYEAFCEKFEEGFSINRFDCGIQLTPRALDECHEVTVDWGDGQTTGPVAGNSGGISHSYVLSGNYQICATVKVPDGSGMAWCFEKDTCWEVCVVCDTCSNEYYKNVWANFPATTDQNGGNNSYAQMYCNGAGDVIVVGTFTGTFDNTPIDFTSSGGWDCFVAKYNNAGTLISDFAFNIGDAGNEIGAVIAPHPTDGFYVGGISYSPSLTIPSPGGGTPSVALNNSTGGWQSVFLARYDNSRNLVWAFNLPGRNNMQINDMAVDADGNVYITGLDDSGTNFNPLSTPSVSFSQDPRAYLAKYREDGALIWIRIFEAPYGLDMTLDPAGNVYLGGEMNGPSSLIGYGPSGSIPTTALITLAPDAPYLLKFDSNGDIQWKFAIEAMGILWGVDANSSSVYVTGGIATGNCINFDPLGSNPDMNCVDVLPNHQNFVARYRFVDGHGLNLAFLDQDKGGMEVETGVGGKVYVGGLFGNSYLQVDVFDQDLNFIKEIRASSVDPKDEAWAICADPFDDLIVAGIVQGTSFDADPPHNDGIENALNDGLPNFFIGKYTCVCAEDSLFDACCDSLMVMAERLTEVDSCCYSIHLKNNVGFDIAKIEAVLLGTDWVFSNVQSAGGFSHTAGSNTIELSYPPVIPVGTTNGALQFCLTPVTSSPPGIQTIVFNWYETLLDSTEQIACSDTIYSDCSLTNTKEDHQPFRAFLFPNPTTDDFTFRLATPIPGKAEVQMVDLWGRVLQQKALVSGRVDHELSVGELSPGVYFVKLLKDGAPVWAEKIIKQ